jgi:hypothetical protein
MLGEGSLGETAFGEGVPRVDSAYAAAAAAFSDLQRKMLVYAQPPMFQELPDPILNIIAKGVERAGPYVGNPDLPESMLQAFAQYEVEQREAKRLRRWNLALAVLAGMMAILGSIVTLIVQDLFFASS